MSQSPDPSTKKDGKTVTAKLTVSPTRVQTSPQSSRSKAKQPEAGKDKQKSDTDKAKLSFSKTLVSMIGMTKEKRKERKQFTRRTALSEQEANRMNLPAAPDIDDDGAEAAAQPNLSDPNETDDEDLFSDVEFEISDKFERGELDQETYKQLMAELKQRRAEEDQKNYESDSTVRSSTPKNSDEPLGASQPATDAALINSTAVFRATLEDLQKKFPSAKATNPPPPVTRPTPVVQTILTSFSAFCGDDPALQDLIQDLAHTDQATKDKLLACLLIMMPTCLMAQNPPEPVASQSSSSQRDPAAEADLRKWMKSAEIRMSSIQSRLGFSLTDPLQAAPVPSLPTGFSGGIPFGNNPNNPNLTSAFASYGTGATTMSTQHAPTQEQAPPVDLQDYAAELAKSGY